MRGGRINGDITGVGVYGSNGCEMIVEFGDLWGFL